MPASRPIWPKASAALVRDQLLGHKLLGLVLAALLYVICVSGVASVFYQHFERWERPRLPDVTLVSPQAAALATADARARMLADPRRKPVEDHLYVTLPTDGLPRFGAAWSETAIGYDAQGRPRGDASHPITHFLVELHYQLHIPGGVGLMLVGMLGVGMAALVIGGLLAHPRILKDAFLLRPRGSKRVALTDVHNRIGVWGAPFHLVIALTGAAIGLTQVVGFAVALAFNGGDTVAVYAPLFGDAAETRRITGGRTLTEGAVLRAMQEMRAKAPEAKPIWIVLHEVAKPTEHLEITAAMPHSTAYGEVFRFDADGRLHSRSGLDDGPAGKQVYASLYPLHFGSYGGMAVKLAYALLGVGLCVMCAGGIDIWLAKSAEKGAPRPGLHKVWTLFVWGMPAALPATAAISLVTGLNAPATFWGLLAATMLAGGVLARTGAGSQATWSAVARSLLGGGLILLPLAHLAVHRSAAPAAAGPNLAMAALGAAMLASTLKRGRRTAAAPQPAEAAATSAPP